MARTERSARLARANRFECVGYQNQNQKHSAQPQLQHTPTEASTHAQINIISMNTRARARARIADDDAAAAAGVVIACACEHAHARSHANTLKYQFCRSCRRRPDILELARVLACTAKMLIAVERGQQARRQATAAAAIITYRSTALDDRENWLRWYLDCL